VKTGVADWQLLIARPPVRECAKESEGERERERERERDGTLQTVMSTCYSNGAAGGS